MAPAARTWFERALWLIALLALGFIGLVTARVLDAQGRTPEILARVAERPLALDSVPRQRIDMLLAVEDPRFYAHAGVDAASPGQGMTSLTQALVKRLYFENFQPGLAKIEQSLIARFVLTPAMSKDDQIEVFLNYASFGGHRGRPVTGFADAARTFYGREFADLTEDQYLSLIAMLLGPRAYHVLREPEANAERVRRIRRMLAGECAPQDLRDVDYEAC